jgi:hypothetical protein
MKNPKAGNKSSNRKKPKAEKNLPEVTDTDEATRIALFSTLPSANAAAVIAEYASAFGEQSVDALIVELRKRMTTVNDGDLQGCENMLIGQAHALQSMFMHLSRRAIKQEYLKNFDAFLRLALKAQSQCRATIETLAELKYPKQATFIKQANIANQQQVNNGVMTKPGLADNYAHTPAPARTENLETSQNELLETTHGQPLERLDSRTAQAASADHQQLETVEAIDRADKS